MGGKTRFVFLACAPIMHVILGLNHARHVHLGGVACTFHDPCWYNVVCGFVVVFLCLLMYKVGFVDMILVMQCVAFFFVWQPYTYSYFIFYQSTLPYAKQPLEIYIVPTLDGKFHYC